MAKQVFQTDNAGRWKKIKWTMRVVLSVMALLLMIIGLFAGNGWQILGYYLLFMGIDASISIAAFLFEKEKLSRLWWIIPQRFGYRWMMYWVMFKSLFKAIKGELQSWGVLKRTGSVKEI